MQRHIAADLHYYSLLRPLSELAVARQFTRTDATSTRILFSNSRTGISIFLGERPANRLARRSKCHFVFLALALFKRQSHALVGILGSQPADLSGRDPAGYDALLEYQDHKPFECVGEGRESRNLMAALTPTPREPRGRADRALRQRDSSAACWLIHAPHPTAAGIDDEQRMPGVVSRWERLRAHLATQGRKVALWGWGREGRAAYAAIRSRLPLHVLTLFGRAMKPPRSRRSPMRTLQW